MKNVRRKRNDVHTDKDVFEPGVNEKVGMTIVDRTDDDPEADRWIRRVRYLATYPCCGELSIITHEALLRRAKAGANQCRSCAVKDSNKRSARGKAKNKAVPDETGWASPPSSKKQQRLEPR